MLKNKNIICISSIDWDFIWQGHQEIMSVFARNGNRVLFIENTGVRSPTLKDMPRLRHRFANWRKGFKGIRKEKENLYIYSPITLPFPYSRIAVKFNRFLMLSVIRRWMNSMEFRNPVVWTFLPTQIVLDLLNALEPSIFIYYCIDDFASSSKTASRIKKVEEKVIKKADLVFATSTNLYNRCLPINKQSYIFPFGISIANYADVRDNHTDIPDDLRLIKNPIIGYIGGIHKWIDMKLIRSIALAGKNLSIVMIGPKQTDLDEIEGLDNVFLLGKKEYNELPRYAKFFDAGIIPYKITRYTDNVYPTKINEYLAMGKPVISTRIPEVLQFDKSNGGNFIYFIEKDVDAGAVIKRALSENNEAAIKKRIETANGNSWDRKIEAMCGLVEKKLEEIHLSMNRSWAERFERIYSGVRRRAIKIAATALLFYILIFHTPLIWFAARPLNVTGLSQRSDCIVVFGGGVGESGKAAQGYEERVGYAAELYKKGFADHLIFSSGYKSVFDETLMMKALAVALGVPGDSIILENTASNTYENVEFTAGILRSKGWSRILLVTAPYHTLRVSLVFEKTAKDINAAYLPLPKSSFYSHKVKGVLSKRVTVKQIKGILHEYLGIAYYKFKGWI
ncbi:MAG: ElyC/SanA/YdcF family protein [Candidatus Omnitrophota bacterium]|nr:ElyC/SanA/YdcF family protein [Candidatus Omnitrophota bacterium]